MASIKSYGAIKQKDSQLLREKKGARIIRRLKERCYPPLGGASKAPGLPQAVAGAFAGRSPHPLCGETDEQEGHCRGRVGPVRRFEGRDGPGAPVEGISVVLSRVWAGTD